MQSSLLLGVFLTLLDGALLRGQKELAEKPTVEGLKGFAPDWRVRKKLLCIRGEHPIFLHADKISADMVNTTNRRPGSAFGRWWQRQIGRGLARGRRFAVHFFNMTEQDREAPLFEECAQVGTHVDRKNKWGT